MVWPNGSHSIPSVSSEFNPARRNPVTGNIQPHQGIDLVGFDTVVAPVSGTIIYAGYNGGYGNQVQIRRPNGDVLSMAHNRAFIRGTGPVSEGEGVAYQGSTGQSTGKHTHYETRPGGGSAVNPRDYMGGNGGAPANVAGGQRTAGPNGVKRRTAPSSQSAEAGDYLAPGTVGNFTGWVHGENVEGNDVWYRGTSGNWFWSGGFIEGANGTGISDLNPTAPPPTTGTQRIVGPEGVKRRIGAPSTSAPTGEGLDAGVVGNFKGWVNGENVGGNAVWFVGISGDYFWSGGFTSTSRDGLADLNTTTPPVTPPVTPPKDPDNPRGLPKTTPVYPGAAFGLEAPLGNGASRSTKGVPPVAVPQLGIDRFIVHHTATTADQLDWFSHDNSRSVCPTWYLRTSGAMVELIRPGLKPAATGSEWNYRSVAVETQNETGAPEWRVTDAQVEALAQAIAWLASYDGKTLDGTPVRFKIDRTHVIGHGQVLATECPGPYLSGKLDAIVARAQVIYAEKYAPTVPGDDDTVVVKRSWLQSLLDALKGLLGSK